MSAHEGARLHFTAQFQSPIQYMNPTIIKIILIVYALALVCICKNLGFLVDAEYLAPNAQRKCPYQYCNRLPTLAPNKKLRSNFLQHKAALPFACDLSPQVPREYQVLQDFVTCRLLLVPLLESIDKIHVLTCMKAVKPSFMFIVKGQEIRQVYM